MAKETKKQNNQQKDKAIFKEKSIVSEDTLSESGTTHEIAIQTEIIQRDYIPMKILQSFNLESEAFPHFLYNSHTITGLFGIIIIVLIGQHFYTEADGPMSLMRNGHIGLNFSAFVFIVYAMIYFPNTIMQRPHPAFWRIVHGIGIFWLAATTFSTFYSKQDLQKFFKVAVDPNLGQPIKQKNFAEDCRFYTPEHPGGNFYNFTSSIDIFFLAHICGWMFKMIITRDFKLCMFQSFLFEILEITFRHWLPNFWECWWDHIILDLIICNTGGMLIGLGLIKMFNMKQYRWSLRTSNEKSYFQNLKEVVLPISLEEHHWKMFSSTKRFLSVIVFLIIFQVLDLNFFFVKFVLDLQPGHTLCKIRTFLMGFLSIPAAREYYEFISNPGCKRMGPYCWNLIAILLMEMILFSNNYDPKIFSAPFPWYVKLIWSVLGFIFFGLLFKLIVNDIRKLLRGTKQIKKSKTD